MGFGQRAVGCHLGPQIDLGAVAAAGILQQFAANRDIECSALVAAQQVRLAFDWLGFIDLQREQIVAGACRVRRATQDPATQTGEVFNDLHDGNGLKQRWPASRPAQG